MLVASHRVALFDRYRIPYTIDPTGSGDPEIVRIAREDGSGPELLALRSRNEKAATYLFDGAALHAALASPDRVQATAKASGGTWQDETPITRLGGGTAAAVRRSSDGSLLVPFDLDAPLDALLTEAYLASPGTAQRAAARSYYALRKLLPRSAQLAVRRRYRVLQERRLFPSWPTETSLHRLEHLLLRLVESVAGEPVPWLSPWPAPYDWALVLTHDVERAPGYAYVDAVRAVEERHGLRSAWYFVPERDYQVDDSALERLRSADCEIGLHGLRHDGRDLSPTTFPVRLPEMKRYANLWGAGGFRAPSTLRSAELVQQLAVNHDSSWSDVARYEPQAGGTCSWFPFFLGDVVELPITLPQDHILFDVLGERDELTWLEKASALRRDGGMALMLTHPDYLLDTERLDAYERFLAVHAGDDTAWHALPGEVASWWRTRARSSIERAARGWDVVGPAAGLCRIRLDAAVLPAVSAFAALLMQ